MDETKSKLFRHKQPIAPRIGENVGGGFIVIARTLKTKRLRPAPWPVEYNTLNDAVIAVEHLKHKMPDETFSIFHQIARVDA